MDAPLIAVRIKDGIFVGNATASQDEDFLLMNKVTHIINCAAGEVRDRFENAGIRYLSFAWKDPVGALCTTVMFDSSDNNIDLVVRFVDKALEMGECVLIHSVTGTSRCCALAAGYLVMKYGWRADSALSFLVLAHTDMSIKPYYLRQLRNFSRRIVPEVDVFDVGVDDSYFALDNDQWMMRNTLLNGLVAASQSEHPLFHVASNAVAIEEALPRHPSRRRRRLTFVDTRQGTAVTGPTTPVVRDMAPTPDAPFCGSRGVAVMRQSRTEPSSIVLRHGTPNTRRLESPNDANAKGKQNLTLKSVAGNMAAVETTVPAAETIHTVERGYFSVSNPVPTTTAALRQSLDMAHSRAPSAGGGSGAGGMGVVNDPPRPTPHVRTPLTVNRARNGSPLPQPRRGDPPAPLRSSAPASPRANAAATLRRYGSPVGVSGGGGEIGGTSPKRGTNVPSASATVTHASSSASASIVRRTLGGGKAIGASARLAPQRAPVGAIVPRTAAPLASPRATSPRGVIAGSAPGGSTTTARFASPRPSSSVSSPRPRAVSPSQGSLADHYLSRKPIAPARRY